jgi:hypothetical protein
MIIRPDAPDLPHRLKQVEISTDIEIGRLRAPASGLFFAAKPPSGFTNGNARQCAKAQPTVRKSPRSNGY